MGQGAPGGCRSNLGSFEFGAPDLMHDESKKECVHPIPFHLVDLVLLPELFCLPVGLSSFLSWVNIGVSKQHNL
jgi:hypothetical protein